MKIYSKIKITLLFLLLSPFALANTELQKAQELIEQGKIEQALDVTEAVLKKDSANIEARFLKGLLLANSERLAEAETVFNALTDDHPELPEPYNNLAVVYAAQGKFEEARDALTKAINTHPSYATAHENLGDIYAKMASRAYNQALELDDGNASAREKLLMVKNIIAGGEGIASQRPEPEPVAIAKAEPLQAEPEPVPPPKPVAAPEPVPAPKPTNSNVDIDPGVEKAVYDWATAWSSQNVDSYLSYYSSRFTPASGLSRSRWEMQREVRLKKPDFIRVEVSLPRVSMIDENSATAGFIQSYTSDNYNDVVKKTLYMVKENGAWKIAQETSE